jgi:hypothetical protein
MCRGLAPIRPSGRSCSKKASTALLDRLQKERQMQSTVAAKPGQMREGMTLVVRLAQLIQTAPQAPVR